MIFFSGLVMKAGIISQVGVKNFFKHHTVVSKIPITSLDPKSTPIFILLNLAALQGNHLPLSMT